MNVLPLGGWFPVAGFAAASTISVALSVVTGEPVFTNFLVVISGRATGLGGQHRGELGQTAQLVRRAAAGEPSVHTWHPGWHAGHTRHGSGHTRHGTGHARHAAGPGRRPFPSFGVLPGCDAVLLKEPADVKVDLLNTMKEVQGGWSGGRTGNWEKLSNSQVCCLAQLCLAAA